MFMLAAFLFVLVPAIVTPEAGRLIVLLCGWEMMLSAYSFYVDAANSRKQLGLVDCLVFVVVNPCLVLAESGKVVGAPRLDPRGLARIALGVLALFGHAALFVGIQLFSGLSDERFASWPALSELPLLIAFYSLHVLLGYMTHSGRASIQIGMMRLMGHELPERYHYPLLAKDPADFWRRWNIYVGVWFRRYVFFPLTVAFSRRVPRRLKNVAMPIAVLATFAACGVWHEMAVYARTGAMQFGMTIVFLLHGALLIGWAGTAALVARRTRWIPQLRLVGASVSRVCFLPALSILTWLILPSVAGVGMHPVLGDMLRWVSR